MLFPLLLISCTIVLFSWNKNIKTKSNHIAGFKPAGNAPDAFNSNTNKKKISLGKMIASVSANKNSNVNFLQETKLSNRKMDIFVSTGSKLNKALYVDDFSNPMIGN